MAASEPDPSTPIDEALAQLDHVAWLVSIRSPQVRRAHRQVDDAITRLAAISSRLDDLSYRALPAFRSWGLVRTLLALFRFW